MEQLSAADYATSPFKHRPPQAIMRILLIEDHPDTAEMCTAVLKLDGHEVRTVHSGRAGLIEAKRHKPEVILSDIGLPDLNGYEIAKLLRNRDEFKNTLMIAITGYTQPLDVVEALGAGFNYHLPKPVDWEKLWGLLVGSAI